MSDYHSSLNRRKNIGVELSIEMKRLRKFAEVDGLALPDNDIQLKTEIANAGILIEDKVYVIDNETITTLRCIVQTIKEEGLQCFFFDSFFDRHQEWADENHITSVEMLREIFVKNQDEILGKDAESYIAKNFVSFKGKCTEKDAVTDEMRRVWGGTSCSIGRARALLQTIRLPGSAIFTTRSAAARCCCSSASSSLIV